MLNLNRLKKTLEEYPVGVSDNAWGHGMMQEQLEDKDGELTFKEPHTFSKKVLEDCG